MLPLVEIRILGQFIFFSSTVFAGHDLSKIIYGISRSSHHLAKTTALGALCIAFLTVGYQSVKTALTNPVESLRAE
jgi:hypothetical protein